MGAAQETGQLELGRASFERREWGAALSRLIAADSETALEPEDLERAATAAQLLAKFEASADLTARAYRELLERGNPPAIVPGSRGSISRSSATARNRTTKQGLSQANPVSILWVSTSCTR